MGEIYKLPVPLCNYQELIRKRSSPYYDVVMYLLREMDSRYKSERRQFTYIPDVEEIEKKMNGEKLSKISIMRSILA